MQMKDEFGFYPLFEFEDETRTILHDNKVVAFFLDSFDGFLQIELDGGVVVFLLMAFLVDSFLDFGDGTVRLDICIVIHLRP